MTCREKLKIEHPDKIDDILRWGSKICPHHYGYLPELEGLCKAGHDEICDHSCKACWDQEIPEDRINRHANLFEEYRQLCHVDTKYIDEWSPYGTDSIKIRFTDGREIIWTLHSSGCWSMETLEHYYQRIAAIRNR